VSQSRTVSQKCPNCGANLDVDAKTELFACEYCGATIAVERKDGDVALAAISAVVAKLTSGSERGAAEMAVKRLTTELAAAEIERARHDARRAAELAPYDAQIDALGETQRGGHVWVDALGVATPVIVWTAIGEHVPVILPVVALVVGWWLARKQRDVAGRLASLFFAWAFFYVAMLLSLFPFSDGGTKPPPMWLLYSLIGVALAIAFVWSAWRTRRRKAKRLASLGVAQTARAAVAARFDDEAVVLRRRVLDVERRVAEAKARADS